MLERLEPRVLMAATFTVDSLADTAAVDGRLTLREAIVAANNDSNPVNNPDLVGHYSFEASGNRDRIVFSGGLSSQGSINLTGPLTITDDLIIDGPGDSIVNGARQTPITIRNVSGRVFVISAPLGDIRVTINGATITGGGTAGGVENHETLVLDAVTLRENRADDGGGVLNNGGSLTITRSTLHDNRATDDGGAIASFNGAVDLTNVTITGNTAASEGGGIYSAATGGRTDTLVIGGSTIASNGSGSGGAGLTFGSASNVSVRNTIISENLRNGSAHDISGPASALKGAMYNLVGVSPGGFSGATNIKGVKDPKLAPLADNGGFTPTRAPLPGSMALNNGDPGHESDGSTDQRGVARASGTDPDIGAFEADTATISGTLFEDLDGNGVFSAPDRALGGKTVEFKADADGDGDLDINQRLTTGTDGKYQISFGYPGAVSAPQDFALTATIVVPGQQAGTWVADASWAGRLGATSNINDLDAGESASGANFLFFKMADLGGLVFHDFTGNGVKDGIDTGQSGRAVIVDRFNATKGQFEVYTYLTTDTAGGYGLGLLELGKYRIRQEQPAGWVQTTAAPATNAEGHYIVDVTGSGQAFLGNDFGNFDRVSIRGTTFNDVNGDGRTPGLVGTAFNSDDVAAGVFTLELVQVKDALGRDVNRVVDTVTSSSTGAYSFADVGPGQFKVRHLDQAGWIKTTGESGVAATRSGADVNVETSPGQQDLRLGYFRLTTVAGHTFNDVTGNGYTLDDAWKGPFTLELVQTQDGFGAATNQVVQTVTSDAGGGYTFTAVGPGQYKVRQVDRAGWFRTTPESGLFKTRSGTGVYYGTSGGADLVFGNFELIDVAGFTFDDKTGNGWTTDDVNTGGFVVELWKTHEAAGTDIADVVVQGTPPTGTGPTGAFTFTGVGPGRYEVRQQTRSGWTTTVPVKGVSTGISGTFTANSGQNLANGTAAGLNDLRFGNFDRIVISGIAFDDDLGDGVLNAGDRPLANRTIYIDADGDGVHDANEQATVTDSNGRYSFANLTPGAYMIRQIVPEGWEETSAPPALIQAISGADRTEANTPALAFGTFERISIDGRLFDDKQGDGDRDAIDQGASDGFTITLTNSRDGSRLAAAPNADGSYRFADLGPGTYSLAITAQDWEATTATTAPIVAHSGGDVNPAQTQTLEAGYFKRIDISGRLFDDIDADGIRDEGELDLANVEVQLVGVGGSVVRAMATAADGSYLFADLGRNGATNAEPYTLRQVLPDGRVQTTPDTDGHLVKATSGQDVVGMVFGSSLAPVGVISGAVFEDLLGDGSRGSGDRGLPDLTVYLDANSNGSRDAGERSTVAAADGSYSFTGLPIMRHAVRVEAPRGWVETSGGAATVTLTVSEAQKVVNVGVFKLITVAGRVYEDVNGDNALDAGDRTLPGMVMQLDLDNDGAIDRTATTDANGIYTFHDVGPGVHRIVQTDTGVYVVDSPSRGYQVVVPVSGRNVSGRDFANRVSPHAPSNNDLLGALHPTTGDVLDLLASMSLAEATHANDDFNGDGIPDVLDEVEPVLTI